MPPRRPRRLASLRSFYRYLRRQGTVTTDPTSGLRNPKQPQRLPRLLRIDDVIRLLDAIPVHTALGVRNGAIFETLYGGGLRVSELVGLNLDDIDFSRTWFGFAARAGGNDLAPLAPWRSYGSTTIFPFASPSQPASKPCS